MHKLVNIFSLQITSVKFILFFFFKKIENQDVKTPISHKGEAMVADFGPSKDFHYDTLTHVSSTIVGTKICCTDWYHTVSVLNILYHTIPILGMPCCLYLTVY